LNANDRLRPLAGSRCLITGGLGFIGSTLAHRLVALGADVTLVDAMVPEYGGNLFNVESIRGKVTINFCDVRDAHALEWVVQGQDYVFHLAGQVSHVLSLTNPYPDLEYNIKGTVVLVESLRKRAPGAKLIFTGTRGQYGPATRLPVDEEAPTNPKGLYEISNLTAEKIIKVYNDVHGLHSVLLRLTNVYGPRAQMRHSQYGVANWFVRLALDGETIRVFGSGAILRDFLYVDDCVEGILLAAVTSEARGEIINLGVDRASSFLELAQTILRVAGSGHWEFAPFTPERKAQDPGDFYSDISKARRLLGWGPATSLEEGLRRTVEFYRAHRDHFWARPTRQAA
jgi:UDP-glucose 4-epimerase